MDSEAARRAVRRGLSWREEALTTLLEAAGLEVPEEWPNALLLDAHPRLQHIYVARHVEEARVWDAMRKARQEVIQRGKAHSTLEPRTVKPPVILMRVRGAPGRKVGRYALMEAHFFDAMFQQLQRAKLVVPAIVRDVNGVAPRVINALQELQGEVIGPNVVHAVRAYPKRPRPDVALSTFEGYIQLVAALVRSGTW